MSQPTDSLRFPLFVTLICVTTVAMGQPAKTLPRAWFDAEGAFGVLVVEYRITNECTVAPDFEVVEHPNIEVTIEEVIVAMTLFIEESISPKIPKDALASASLEVFGQKTLPNRSLKQSEFEALKVVWERLGPWPYTQTMPLGSNSYRCSFDKNGLLTKVEKLNEGTKGYSEFEGQLAEQGPFRLRWEVVD